ncbi:hypothetical protein JW960_20570, partial [candidate division KSB1 bacterium]|nr:hypothetical protein [candidate division KSB1 bacterium]
MKKIVILLTIFVNAELLGQSEFVWQNPLPQGNQLNDLYIFSDDEVIFVGDYGTVMKTTDGGETWDVKHQVAEVTENLESVSFVGDTGWVSGDFGSILKSFDRGENWQYMKKLSPAYFSQLHFVNKNTGWVYSLFGSVYKSHDGGITWSMKKYFSDIEIVAGCFVDENRGWLVGFQQEPGYILRTVDGGYTWDNQYSNVFAICDICFVDSMKGYAVGYSGDILKTINGGEEWELIFSDSNCSFNSVEFVNADTGWVAGREDTSRTDGAVVIYKTTDGGKSWNNSYVECGRTLANYKKLLSKIKFLNENTGWALPYQSSLILQTKNGGESWKPCTSELLESFNYVRFWGPDTGVVFSRIYGSDYDGHNTYRTIDGGTNWQRISDQSASVSLKSPTFFDPDTGYAIHNNGFLYKTTNGGTHWNKLTIGDIRETIRNYWFHSTDSGLAFMGSGIIQKTEDGGETWEIVGNHPNYYYSKIFFVDQDYGWIIATDSTILYKTENGGRDWQVIETHFDVYRFDDIYFVTPNIGWIVTAGRNGDTIYKTTNGGIDWINQNDGTRYHEYEAMYFQNANIGWLACDPLYGVVKKTVDGGATWQLLKTNSTKYIRSLYALDENTCWAAGQEGMIIKFTENEPALTQLIAQPSVPD